MGVRNAPGSGREGSYVATKQDPWSRAHPVCDAVLAVSRLRRAQRTGSRQSRIVYLAARDSFRGGDIDKTQVHLEKLAVLESPFQEGAAAWSLLINNGPLAALETRKKS
jgi:hypothetical protein